MSLCVRSAAAWVLVMLPAILPLGAQTGPSAAERTLLDLANRERVQRGLAPLAWDDALAEAARRHAARMAGHRVLSHQLPGEPDLAARAAQAGARFTLIAENIAQGPDAAAIHGQWMRSPPHRANLLDSEMDSAGIAVTERDGVLYAVQNFSRAAPALTLEDQEKTVARQLAGRGLRLLDRSADARKACTLERGFAGSRKPRFVMQYETADLSRLPDALEQQIESGRYETASVGACDLRRPSDFANYRIAVLLD